MKHFLSTATVSLLGFVFVNVLPAQDAPKMINGGILNGKAISLPKPAYPEEAKAAKISATVKVKVTIDEYGQVISAEAVSDNPADETSISPERAALFESLDQAAEKAALDAKFSPTLLQGEPVKVTGMITYRFVADDGDSIKELEPKGGVLNGKAISLPNAVYPDAAKAVKAAGTVMVQVTIDEDGNVISAIAVGGHPLLRNAAIKAAGQAKFAPTFVNGSATKVTGTLTYNFVLPDEG